MPDIRSICLGGFDDYCANVCNLLNHSFPGSLDSFAFNDSIYENKIKI